MTSACSMVNDVIFKLTRLARKAAMATAAITLQPIHPIPMAGRGDAEMITNVRSRGVSNSRDWYFHPSYRFKIWQAPRQQRCRCAYSNYKAIWQFWIQISQIRDFVRFYDSTSKRNNAFIIFLINTYRSSVVAVIIASKNWISCIEYKYWYVGYE